MTATTLKMAMADPGSKPKAGARPLGITTAALYTDVNEDGSVKEAENAYSLVQRSKDRSPALTKT